MKKKIFILLVWSFLILSPVVSVKAFSWGDYKNQLQDFMLVDKNISSPYFYQDDVNRKFYSAFLDEASSSEMTSRKLFVNVYGLDDFKIATSVSPVLASSTSFGTSLFFSRNDKNGNYGLLWSELSLNASSSKKLDLYYQVMDRDGVFIGNKIKINDDGLSLDGRMMNNNFEPVLSYDGDGNALVLWSSTNTANNSSAIFGQKLNLSGKDGNNFLLDGTKENDNFARQNPRLLFWKDKYLLVWNVGLKIRYLFLNKELKDLDKMSQGFMFLDETGNAQRESKLMANKDYLFVVYTDFSPADVSKSDLVYRRYTSDNSLFGEKIRLADYANGVGYDAKLLNNDLYLLVNSKMANAGGKFISTYRFNLSDGPAELLEKVDLAKKLSESWQGGAWLAAGSSYLMLFRSDEGLLNSGALFVNIFRKNDLWNKCAVSDWKEFYLSGTCPGEGVVTRKWFKTGLCEGGDVKPAIERDVNCDGSVKVKILPCTGLNWMLSYEPQICPASGFQVEKWVKVGDCEGGLQKVNGRKTACDYEVVANGTVVGKIDSSKKEEELKNSSAYNSVKGKILIKTEESGRAYYVSPRKMVAYYLGRPEDAFAVMRGNGLGITNNDLAKIPVGLIYSANGDSDGDGLSDLLEVSLGTNVNKRDSDGDGFDDKSEVLSGFSPLGLGKFSVDKNLAKKLSGLILLQVEGKGEAWYINPADGKRYFLGRPADAFAVMRSLGLGIANKNFDKLKK